MTSNIGCHERLERLDARIILLLIESAYSEAQGPCSEAQGAYSEAHILRCKAHLLRRKAHNLRRKAHTLRRKTHTLRRILGAQGVYFGAHQVNKKINNDGQ